MAERTREQQAQFDAAELINKSKEALPPAEDVVLEVQSVTSGSKTTIKE